MLFKDATTYNELLRLAQTNPAPVNVKLTGIIYADGQAIGIRNVVSLHCQRNYMNDNAEILFVTVQIGQLSYLRLIEPARDKLKFELLRTIRDQRGLEAKVAETVKRTYRAWLADSLDIALAGGDIGDDETDENSLMDITFQLTDPKHDEMRYTDMGGIHRDKTLKELMQQKLGFDLEGRGSTAGLDNPDYQGVRGVDVYPPSNDRLYKHIPVDSGTPLTKLPTFLQKTKGVYASGIGQFYQDGRWYIFPLLDVTRFDAEERALTVLNIPPDEMITPERSFIYEAKQLYIFSTGGADYLDSSENTFQRYGSSVSFTPASGNLLNEHMERSNNKALPRPDKTQMGYSVTKRPMDEAKTINTYHHFTDNPYPMTSEMALGRGVIIKVGWENADPSLLYPGMPVKLLYVMDGDVTARYGTLVSVDCATAPSTGQILDDDYRSHSTLTLFLDRNVYSEASGA